MKSHFEIKCNGESMSKVQPRIRGQRNTISFCVVLLKMHFQVPKWILIGAEFNLEMVADACCQLSLLQCSGSV